MLDLVVVPSTAIGAARLGGTSVKGWCHGVQDWMHKSERLNQTRSGVKKSNATLATSLLSTSSGSQVKQ